VIFYLFVCWLCVNGLVCYRLFYGSGLFGLMSGVLRYSFLLFMFHVLAIFCRYYFAFFKYITVSSQFFFFLNRDIAIFPIVMFISYDYFAVAVSKFLNRKAALVSLWDLKTIT